MVVTSCGAGHRSSYVAKKLREAGYNLDGISFWEKENLPLIRGPKLPLSEEPAIIHLEEAYENYYLLFKDIVWVDVRETEDYKRGHVKVALDIPLSEIESMYEEVLKECNTLKNQEIATKTQTDREVCILQPTVGRCPINSSTMRSLAEAAVGAD